ncbi:heparanase [Plakobranchus ocellatus]|uniref:Heparanase n=1 Tax=Plakobranchus ocellatus TaxID=259542 RepID=A0AAV3ZV57_9GAST|nr:heparanase [Plakobranchus ocellatus]
MVSSPVTAGMFMMSCSKDLLVEAKSLWAALFEILETKKMSRANCIAHLCIPVVLVCLAIVAAAGWLTGRDDQLDNVLRFSQVSEEKPSPVSRLVLVIDVSRSLHITAPRYLSLTISGGQMRRNLEGFDFSSEKLKTMAAALAPTYVRFGGTMADYLHFDPDGVDSPDPEEESEELPQYFDSLFEGPLDQKKKNKLSNFTMSGERWDNLTRFCDEADWDIMWDFNLLYSRKGQWDPSYAKKFLKYNAARGVKIPSFQLGNEPNLYKRKYNINIGAHELADDFHILKDLIAEFPQYDVSGIYGPDPTNLDKHKSARNYLAKFLKDGGCEAVNEVSLHQWLDKLGLAAKNGVTHVFRQTFFGSNYALLTRELEPNPDFFLSVLYKRLVEGPVFHVVTAGMSPQLRLYAHCVRKGYYNYPDGALVVYYLNMAGTLSHVALDRYQNTVVDLFVFTPGDGDGLKSRKINMNGKLLAMKGAKMPKMKPLLHTGDIPVPPESYGFIVIPYAEVPLCKIYHRSA